LVDDAADTEPCCDVSEHAALSAPCSPPTPLATLDEAAIMFRALGDSARLAVLEQLLHAPCCVTDIAQTLGERVSTISQRLKILLAAHLVRRRREGKHIFYSLADEHVRALIQNVLAHAAEAQHR
jgi:DNA-binding transcriptional ArsR family regulator